MEENRQEFISVDKTENLKESELIDNIRDIEKDFLDELQKRFGTWRVCGDASQALAHIISHKNNLPIGVNLPNDHIEVAVGTFAPEDQSKTEEETYLKAHIGDSIYFIDPIYGLLYWKNPHREIMVRKYSRKEFKAGIERDWKIKDFDPNNSYIQKAMKAKTADETQGLYSATLKYLNNKTINASIFSKTDNPSVRGIIDRPRWAQTRAIVEKFTGINSSSYEDQSLKTIYSGGEASGEDNSLTVHFGGIRYYIEKNGDAKAFTRKHDYNSERQISQEELERIKESVDESEDKQAQKIFEDFKNNRLKFVMDEFEKHKSSNT